mmetsp:Transcript_10654/g.27443  ORF Transcript_10654/g.27443 Transcript_10654/m.27443 type:complete len:282 (+) Transcript_10654:404-1249(+)
MQVDRRRALERVGGGAFAGAAGERGPVGVGMHAAEAALVARVLGLQEPGEGQRALAQRALRQVNADDTDAVEVVLAWRGGDCLHQQRLPAEGADGRAVEGQGVVAGCQLQPLQLLRVAYEVLVRPLLLHRQRLEEVAAAAALRTDCALPLRRRLPRRVPMQRLDELAHHVAHLELRGLAREVRLELRLAAGSSSRLGEVRVQEAREGALRGGHADALRHVRGRGLLSTDGALRDPVLTRLVCDGSQHEALPAEAVTARELHHVGDRLEADGALVRLTLLAE